MLRIQDGAECCKIHKKTLHDLKVEKQCAVVKEKIIISNISGYGASFQIEKKHVNPDIEVIVLIITKNPINSQKVGQPVNPTWEGGGLI